MPPRTTCNRTRASLAAALMAFTPLVATASDAGGAREALDLLDRMHEAWQEIADYTKRVEKTERLVNGDVTRQTVFIKYRQPGQFYMRVLDGENEGGELIYPARPGSNLAIAHAGGFKGGFARFLQKTVILRRVVPTEFRLDDPELGAWQHQTAPDTSFGATIDQITRNVRLAVERGEGQIHVTRNCETEAKCLLKIDFTLPMDVGEVHRVADGENLWSIAADYGRPMYVIWYNNPEVRGPRKLKPGQSLFLPRYYAARGTVTVSPDTLLPTRIEIHDADGRLYELYVYDDVRLNVGLTDRDFDPENPDYRF